LSNAIDISLFKASGPGVVRPPSNSRVWRFAKGETREARKKRREAILSYRCETKVTLLNLVCLGAISSLIEFA